MYLPNMRYPCSHPYSTAKPPIQVNISIMRVVVKMRLWAANYQNLVERIDALQQTQGERDQHIVL